MAKIGLSSPWILFYHEVSAFFKSDKEVTVIYDEEKNHLKLYVDNPVKADALSQLMVPEKTFGKVTVKVFIIPSNIPSERALLFTDLVKDTKGLFEQAFSNNPSVVSVKQVDVFTNPLIYVVFRPEVIQYFTDSLGDINGICSTLNQEIVKDIFRKVDNVYYCTDKISISSITNSTIRYIFPDTGVNSR